MEKNLEVNLGGDMDILQGRWLELKGLVKQRWGKLTDDDVARLTGKRDELIGILQQRYGFGKEQAELEINKWLRSFDKKPAGQAATSNKA